MHPAGHCGAASGVRLRPFFLHVWICLLSCLLCCLTGQILRQKSISSMLDLPVHLSCLTVLLCCSIALPQVAASVVAQAKAALDNTRLCGEPQLRDVAEGTAGRSAFAAAAGAGGAEDGLASGAVCWSEMNTSPALCSAVDGRP